MSISLSALTQATYRKTMSCYATGIAVVTLNHPDHGKMGITINSLTSVSLDPLLLLFCLGRYGQLFPAFQGACDSKSRFGLTMLADDQEAFSRCFTHHDPLFWEDSDSYDVSEMGVPYLKNGVAYLEAIFEANVPGGDHAIFIGRALKGQFDLHKKPLLYHHGHYKTLLSEPFI